MIPKRKIDAVVAMSGGVDSSIAAYILLKQGYNIVGVTLRLYDIDSSQSKGCCSLQDIQDAKAVSRFLNFPHYVLDYREKFQCSVINPFLSSYQKGETPVPCVYCNQTVKFVSLLNMAQSMGACFLATGHYARIRLTKEDQSLLFKAKDFSKDQSYFLFGTTQAQLSNIFFPLGDLHKRDVRRIARDIRLPNHDKKESQDICFVGKNDYRSSFSSVKKGKILYKNICIGFHDGVWNYTVGQRKKIPSQNNGKPLYVTCIDPKNNTVHVDLKENVGQDFCCFSLVNWLAQENIQYFVDNHIYVRILTRSRGFLSTCLIKNFCKYTKRVMVLLFGSRDIISPGQAAVLYSLDGMQVLGGGWITLQQNSETV